VLPLISVLPFTETPRRPQRPEGHEMKLRELFTSDVVKLDLESETKDALLQELVALLGLDAKSEATLFKTLKRRENLGSTGIGKGIAIPHCRSLCVSRLRLAYGRKTAGVDFNSIDGAPVHNFFLIVAPPLEVSNQYLPVLGKIAQFAKDPEVPGQLMGLTSPEQFLSLLEQKAP
jgi:mannitol/fructose-specific phosphotransferase system IIA component (Ntr-type)